MVKVVIDGSDADSNGCNGNGSSDLCLSLPQIIPYCNPNENGNQPYVNLAANPMCWTCIEKNDCEQDLDVEVEIDGSTETYEVCVLLD